MAIQASKDDAVEAEADAETRAARGPIEHSHGWRRPEPSGLQSMVAHLKYEHGKGPTVEEATEFLSASGRSQDLGTSLGLLHYQLHEDEKI